MDPQSDCYEDNVGHQGTENSKNHDICEVLEEPLAAHVVTWGEYDRWDAEIKQDVVVEDYVLLDHIVVRAVGSQTYQETYQGYVTGFVAERDASRCLLLTDDNVAENEAEEHQRPRLNDRWFSVSHFDNRFLLGTAELTPKIFALPIFTFDL